jgi:hypothetical protein
MLHRRAIVFGLALSLAPALLASAARAESSPYALQVEKELRQQGYTKMTVSRSWFGRTLIHAESKTERREIVLNPRTGEILRDYTRPLKGSGGAREDILGSHGGSSGSGGGSSGGSTGGTSSSSGSGGHSGSSDGGDSGGSDHSSSGDGSSDD